MPYVDNQGVRIYYEIEGKGPPLVLLYGIFQNVDMWRSFGYVDLLGDDYQLILIDIRGHGRSDKPHNPAAYRASLLVADVIAVLDDLSLSTSCLLGYSLGADIAYWAAARYTPERVSALILGGGHPDTRVPEPGWEPGKLLIERWKLRHGMGPLLALVKESPWLTPETESVWRSNDAEAMVALLSAEGGILFPEPLDWMSTVAVPSLIYIGDDDDYAGVKDDYRGAKIASESMTNVAFVSLPGLDHLDAMFRSDLVVPHIRKFLAEVGES